MRLIVKFKHNNDMLIAIDKERIHQASKSTFLSGEEQNREERENSQEKLGGGRNRGKN